MKKIVYLLLATFLAGSVHATDFSTIQVQDVNKQTLKVGEVLFVTTYKLNLRSAPTLTSESIVGSLAQNDQVEIIDMLDPSSTLVKIKVLKSGHVGRSLPDQLYVSAEYLSPTAVDVVSEADRGQTSSKYIIVLNIASEKVRVYERCTSSPGCPHHLIMETDTVVGRPSGGNDSATGAGHFKIQEWVKFYQDSTNNGPSWYDPNYPPVPPPNASMSAWLSKKNLPGYGLYRGALGWYTALLGPDAGSEWLHGTFGWGADGDKFIKATRGESGGPLARLVAILKDLRSHGCTRVENRAIAYIRHLAPVGTDVFRVYAKEAYADPSLSAYQNQQNPLPWDYVLTKEGVRQSGGPDSDRNSVLARHVSQDLILEQGQFLINQMPRAVPYIFHASSRQRRHAISGNIYDIDDSAFRGALLVDTGRFVDYAHPAGIIVGGFPDHGLPDYMKSSGPYTLAQKK